VHEKQTVCFFCHSWFANSYEAECHELSAHLRFQSHHSRSYATLNSNPEAISHTFTDSSRNDGSTNSAILGLAPPADICIYCGQRFPHDPLPDWGKRKSHLMVFILTSNRLRPLQSLRVSPHPSFSFRPPKLPS